MSNSVIFKSILKKIKENDSIIILRHKSPDYDAYGSQIGLYYVLRENFKDKFIYVDGDENGNNLSSKTMDNVAIDIYKKSLVLVLDTSQEQMVPDDKYKEAKFVIVFDHHNVDKTIGNLEIVRDDYSSASELVSEFVYESNLKVTKEAADMFFIGIAGDSNRFLYKGTSSNTFKIVSRLIDDGADIINDYKIMQKEESENEKRIKGYILENFKIKDRVAYITTNKKTREKYGASDFFVSRGCINLLSGIKGVDTFVGFTEMDNDEISVEFRSKEKSVVNVAKRNGGGGHELACGCRIESFDECERIIDEVIKELNNESL